MESSKHQAAHFSDRRDLLEAPEGEGYFTDTGQIREIYSAVPCLLNKVSVEQPRRGWTAQTRISLDPQGHKGRQKSKQDDVHTAILSLDLLSPMAAPPWSHNRGMNERVSQRGAEGGASSVAAEWLIIRGFWGAWRTGLWWVSGEHTRQFAWQFAQAGQAGRVASFLASKECSVLFEVFLLPGYFWGVCQ